MEKKASNNWSRKWIIATTIFHHWRYIMFREKRLRIRIRGIRFASIGLLFLLSLLWACNTGSKSRNGSTSPDSTATLVRTNETPPASVLPTDKAKNVEDILRGARDKSADEKIKALTDSTNILRPYTDEDPDLQSITAVLELERDRLEIFTNRFQVLVNKIKEIENPGEKRFFLKPETKKAAAKGIRLSLLKTETYLIQVFTILAKNKNSIIAEQAGALLERLRLAAQVVDDLNDAKSPPEKEGSAESKETIDRFLEKAKELVGLNVKTDQDTKEKLADYLGKIESIAKRLGTKGAKNATSPMPVLNIPLAVANAHLGKVKRAWEETTKVMDNLSGAMDGDPAALKRMIEGGEKVKQTLSGENFGKAMLKALLETVGDSIINNGLIQALSDLLKEKLEAPPTPTQPRKCSFNFNCKKICGGGIMAGPLIVACEIEQTTQQQLCNAGKPYKSTYKCR